jgi:hypothetical protein
LIHLSNGQILESVGDGVRKFPKILKHGFIPTVLDLGNLSVNLSQVVYFEYLTKEQYEQRKTEFRAF